MNIFQKVTLSTVLFAGAIGFASAQSATSATSALEAGLHSVAEFHGITTQEAVASESLRAEACLVGPALRVVKNPGKAVPAFQILPGGQDMPLEHRVLQSTFRPAEGEFTWLQTAEGWYVVLPSKERFETLLNRTSFPVK
ncbi:MAG: hypothetical protein ACPH97_02400 [Flavobacteriales bacterium]